MDRGLANKKSLKSFLKRMPAYLVVLVGLLQAIVAYNIPIRGDEAFLYFKGKGMSFADLPFSGLNEAIISLSSSIGDEPFYLRLPSIIFICLSMFFLYRLLRKVSSYYGTLLIGTVTLISPFIYMAYISATLSAFFFFLSVLFLYYMYLAIASKKSNYFLIVSLISILGLLLTPFFLVYIFSALIFQLLYGKSLENRALFLGLLFNMLLAIVLLLLDHFGKFSFFFKYPLSLTALYMNRIFILLALMLEILAGILLALHFKTFKESGSEEYFKDQNSMRFIIIAYLLSFILLIIFIIFPYIDVRNLAALLLPAVIICAYFYERFKKGAFITLIITTVLTLIITALPNKVLPGYLQASPLYRTMQTPVAEVIANTEAIISNDMAFSSIMAFYMPNNREFGRVEACTLEHCKKSSGIFMSYDRRDDLDKYFMNISESGSYRITSSINKGGGDMVNIYFYKVEGRKKQ